MKRSLSTIEARWHRSLIRQILLVLLALVSCVLLVYISQPGMSIPSDAVRYMMGAVNLEEGNGYVRFAGDGSVKPLVVFPPGYPALLTMFLAGGLDKFAAARVLNIILLPLTVYLIGWIVYRGTSHPILALLAPLTLIASTAVLRSFKAIMSEAPFMFFSVLAVFLLLEYLEKRSRVVRYLGFAFLPTAVAFIFLFHGKTFQKRLLNSFMFLIPGVLPIVLWFARNARLTGDGLNRTLTYQPLPPHKIAGYVDEVISWFIPAVFQLDWRPRLSHLAVFLAVVFLVFVILEVLRLKNLFLRSRKGRAYDLLTAVSFVFMIGYLAILFISSTILDVSLQDYPRYLAPAYVLLILVMAGIVHSIVQCGAPWRKIGGAGIGLWIVILGFHFQYLRESLHILRTDRGLGASLEVLGEARDFLNNLDQDRILISNNIDLVYLMMDKYAFMIPVGVNAYSGEPTTDYDHQLAAYQGRMEEGAVLVYFGSAEAEGAYASYEELSIGMDVIHTSTYNRILSHPDFAP